jgi:hypothetical protein
MGRYAEAFAAFAEGKRLLRALTGLSYRADEAAALARRLTGFFVTASSKSYRAPASAPKSPSRSSSSVFPAPARP